MIIEEDDYLAHYGILRKSGRYPWGSGDNPLQRSRTFSDAVAKLRSEGMSESDIATAFGMSVKQLRETNTIASNARRAAEISYAQKLRDEGHSNMAIARKMDKPESTIRSMLAEGQKEKLDILTNTANMLRDEVDKGDFIQIGTGVENHLGISKEKLSSAVAILKDEGYEVHSVQVPQAGSSSNMTTVKVLTPPGTTYLDAKTNMDRIRMAKMKTDDGGRTYFGMLPPKSLDSSRVQVAYKEDGGNLADGVMYVRPGLDDLSLGGSRYAQVRVLVDGTHYLKGMAIYKDDLPDGVDVLFNTNKAKADIGDNKLDALKKITDDPDNPFGAVVSQIGKHDERGNLTEVTSVFNLVNKEGDWEGWKNSISSQVLSKQAPGLAKEQLQKAYDAKKAEFDEIMALTNPVVKRKLLHSLADSADSAAVHLKAASLDRQASHVILPVNTMREDQVYAPNYNTGDRVVLIRYPHGGTFEIPELTVNNNHPDAKSMLGQARDAIGINAKVAERLSGADFDGDSVLVIPNDSGRIKTSPPLEKLKNFDPQREFAPYDGMRTIDGGIYRADTKTVDYEGRTPSGKGKGQQMGLVSNLITDMTIQKASTDELARAVAHSMVVIDAEKHKLDYKRSEEVHGIAALRKKYQAKDDGRSGGSATLISRATGEVRVRARKARPMKKGGPIDPATGKKMWVDKGDSWIDEKGKERYPTQKSVKLAETDDAYTLVSKNGGTLIERVYADHSNRLKALANEVRKAEVAQGTIPMSPSAKKVYSKEVASLKSKLSLAQENAPRERQAQLYANRVVELKRQANPNMDGSQIKRANSQALNEGRNRFGAKRTLVDITPSEWDAIQAGAVSTHTLKSILDNTDIEKVKSYATPRPTRLMSGSALSKAKAMQAAGRTQAEIASALGVSVTTVKEGLKDG